MRSSSLAAVALLIGACTSGEMVEVASGFDILARARPALANDGTVVAARSAELLVGDGVVSSTIDLSGASLTIAAVSGRKRMQVRDEGDLVFQASRPGMPMGCPLFLGVYTTTSFGGPIATTHETCPSDSPGPALGAGIAMSTNGTVAFADIRNGQGAIYRQPVGAAPQVLRSGTGEFFNFGGLDVNDAGQVPIQMEYFDGFAGGLMRGVLVFETVEQEKLDTNTAVEKLNIGTQPAVAINDLGTVALASNTTMSFPIGGTVYSFEPGVYTATPTLFNTPKMLTEVATLSGDYCRVGAVDINDAGTVVFEAQLDSGFSCGGTSFDGIFDGADPATDGVVEFADDRLGPHQFFDSVFLGEINDSGQISFATTYSEPLVEPVKIWRYDP
ncbi:MAG: hypothetical protein AAF721_02795 [Myxococcota bacterium]